MGRRGSAEKREEVVVVAIDKDKGSQYALKWAVDHILNRGQSLTLLHVQQKTSVINTPSGTSVTLSDVNADVARTYKKQLQHQANELFFPFRCFCSRKDLKCNEIIVDDMDIPRAIVDFVSHNSADILVLGSPSRGGIMRRFKMTDVPSSVSKATPDFCTVYVIGKGKISSVRSATAAPLKRITNQSYSGYSDVSATSDAISTPRETPRETPRVSEISSTSSANYPEEMNTIMSPFNRGKAPTGKYEPEANKSYASNGRPSTDRSSQNSLYDKMDSTNWYSSASEYDPRSFGSPSNTMNKQSDMGSYPSNLSSNTQENSSSRCSSHSMDDVDAEMRRLRAELQQTMDMYSSACKETIVAKHKATELHQWKMEEEQKLEDVQLSEKAAFALVEREQAKAKAALEAAKASQRLAELEAQKRTNVEKKAIKVSDSMSSMECRYRRYTIEEIEAATENYADSRKIGEGGYGPVYRCTLDHTPVAVKILRSDVNQGRAQFNQEIEVLSRMRHPNMVLLLGACPEYGCLVYEHMVNGSLDDCLFHRGKNPPLPWQARFRIAAEIATGLLFLHQSKPEPLVHRDLKPGNILLDRNYVSKISDVGLARLVPSSVADSVTQYHMTATAGTFCYIDPEYQQTGMLGTKSDIYSLGIMLLQIITAKPPMGLTHHVERAIEKGTFPQMLDQAVTDWPIAEALSFAKLSLQCAELRRKDRPDLGKVVLLELNRLRELAEESTPVYMYGGMPTHHYQPSDSSLQDVISNRTSGYDSRDST